MDGGVGDVTSKERGTGARFNSGKPDLSLIPLWYIAELEIQKAYWAGYECPDVTYALRNVGWYQTTGDPKYLYTALISLNTDWTDCARVFEYGKKKYAAWNWRKGMNWSIPIACIGRHALAIFRGEENDPESGLPHIGHIQCNIVMLLDYIDSYPEGNDLPFNVLTSQQEEKK